MKGPTIIGPRSKFLILGFPGGRKMQEYPSAFPHKGKSCPITPFGRRPSLHPTNLRQSMSNSATKIGKNQE